MKIRTYFVKVLDGMAKGLFASLIIGVIITQIGTYTGIDALVTFGRAAQFMMGPAIGAGIALARKVPMFSLLAAITAGAIGAGTVQFTELTAEGIRIGEPIGAALAAIAAVEIGRLLEGRTKFDLLVVPGCMVLAATVIGTFISPPVSDFIAFLGEQIMRLTALAPIPLGILVGISIGLLLTSPVSSAAICVAMGIGGLAAGAALAGGAAQMIGFAVMSFRENKVGGLVSQGLGTSMLQMPNIIKNPWIWLPPTVASGVGGFLAAVVFNMETNSVGAGMGTSGLVGPFTAFTEMGGGADTVVAIIIVLFVTPAVISLCLGEIMRKKGLIKFGDLKI